MAFTIGSYIVSKRIEKGLSAKQLASKLNISPNYMCEIEKGKKCWFSDSVLEKAKELLCDNYIEEIMFYDLIAKERKTIPKDILDYIADNNSAKNVLRFAIIHGLTDDDWNAFLNLIKENYK